LVPLRRKPPLLLTEVLSVKRTTVSTPLISRTVNVSASRRVTTPLIFIFCPLETERALDASVGALFCVESCPNANGERASANPKASADDLTAFVFIIVFNSFIDVSDAQPDRAEWLLEFRR